MQVFLLVTVGWIFSVCLHEFGHAFVAYKGGDYTVREKGYLTLNPIHYTDPVFSLIMPVVFLLLGGIGLPGGAVYINDHLLRSKGWRTGVSLAGPFMNLVIIFFLCIPFWMRWMDNRFGPAIAFLVQLQISAVLFNLIPIPPLDGFRAISPWLSEEFTERVLRHSSTFMWVFFLVMWYVQPVNHAFWSIVYTLSNMLGVDSELAQVGFSQFRFWSH